jgi:hypothetical protein
MFKKSPTDPMFVGVTVGEPVEMSGHSTPIVASTCGKVKPMSALVAQSGGARRANAGRAPNPKVT